MKMNFIFRAALSFLAAAFVLSSCTKEDNISEGSESTETVSGVTIPYTVTVSREPETRATVDGDMRTLCFAEGDKLYIGGFGVKGVLDIQTGVGETSGATFSGKLTYTGQGKIPDNFLLLATLVSAQQTVGKEVSVDGKGVVSVNYPRNEYCATLEEAVQRYSLLEGWGIYSMESFSLSQSTAFLNFEMTFEDDTPVGTEISAAVTTNRDNGPICTANVTTREENGKVVAKFVLPQAASSALNNASVKLGEGDGVSFGANGKKLEGKVYNVNKVVFSRPMNEIPLTVKALTAGTVKVDIIGTLSTGMKYSVNGVEKTLITETRDIPVSAGDKVQFYGNGTSTQVYGNYPKVRIQGGGDGFKCKAYGNIMSLLDEDGFATKTDLPNESQVFSSLFSGNTALTDASDLLLPATSLTERCYEGMFSLCSALTKAPALPAETLASFCYSGMFRSCTALTRAPKLPATTLANYCYLEMFLGCSALTTAPDLLATKLVQGCYARMFFNCTSLNSVKCLATSGIAENDSTYEMLVGVAATGTFHLANGVLWTLGNISGIPSEWTGRYPDGVIMSNPFPMIQALPRHLGKVIGSDGLVYESGPSADHVGVTPIAVIAYTPPTGNYMAVSIREDSDSFVNWYDAKKICEGKTKPSGFPVTWLLPDYDDWKAVLKANGGNEYSIMGLNTLITDAGGESFFLNLPYWTSTLSQQYADWAFALDLTDGKVKYTGYSTYNKICVRSFLLFISVGH